MGWRLGRSTACWGIWRCCKCGRPGGPRRRAEGSSGMGCPVLGSDNLPGMICMKQGHRAGENTVTPAVTLPAR